MEKANILFDKLGSVFWAQLVLSRMDRISCSRKQGMDRAWLELMSNHISGSQSRHAYHYTTLFHCLDTSSISSLVVFIANGLILLTFSRNIPHFKNLWLFSYRPFHPGQIKVKNPMYSHSWHSVTFSWYAPMKTNLHSFAPGGSSAIIMTLLWEVIVPFCLESAKLVT